MQEKDKIEKDAGKILRNSVIRMAFALLLSALMLAATGFAQIKMIKGPVETDAIQKNEGGDFVSRDIYAILGFFADDVNAGGEAKGRYAVVPMNDKFVSVHFSKRYLESAEDVYESTNDFVNGKISQLDVYVTVEGTVSTLSEEASGLMYDWFGENKTELIESKMIADTDDYSDYLSDYVLNVDMIGNFSETLLAVLTCISGVLLLYAIVEIILMAAGFYLPREAEVQTGRQCLGAPEESTEPVAKTEEGEE